MVLENISYYPIFEVPLIFYLGIVTFLSFFFTASIAVMNKRGVKKIPIKWHFILAKISISFALVHGILGILAYL